MVAFIEIQRQGRKQALCAITELVGDGFTISIQLIYSIDVR